MRPFYVRSKIQKHILAYVFAIDNGIAYITDTRRDTKEMRAITTEELLRNWDFVGHYA